uniref:STAS domain-containing protein n=1 Tax=Panagrolaimus superbus TaxID=310955 RepID=A0A914YP42_9BILA
MADEEIVRLRGMNQYKRRLIIIDCSAICFIDTMGAEIMCEARKFAAESCTDLVYADIPEPVLDVLLLKDFKDFLPMDALYPNVREALKAAGIDRL